MPAIGFAMLLKIMLKKEYVCFLIGGFVLVTWFKISIIGLALVGLATAMYDYYASESRGTQIVKEEFEDGI